MSKPSLPRLVSEGDIVLTDDHNILVNDVDFLLNKLAITPILHDDTVVSTTNTDYTTVKSAYFPKLANLFDYSSLAVSFEIASSSDGTTIYLGVFIDGEATPRIEFSTDTTTGQHKTGTIDISDLSDGLHLVEVKLKTTNSSVYAYNRHAFIVAKP